MGPKRPGRAASASLVMLVVAVVAIAGSAAFLGRRAAPHQSPATGSHRPAWTTSWAAMPQLTEPANMPPAALAWSAVSRSSALASSTSWRMRVERSLVMSPSTSPTDRNEGSGRSSRVAYCSLIARPG